MTAEQVAAGVVELDDLVRADGGRLVLEAWEEATASVRLRLVIDDAECAECIVPRQLLEGIALDRLRRLVPQVTAVSIDDPRETP